MRLSSRPVRTFFGLLLALAIGAATGAALPEILTLNVAAPPAPPTTAVTGRWVQVGELKGRVERWSSAGWRPIRPGEALSWPLGLRLRGDAAYLGLTSEGLRLALNGAGTEVWVGRSDGDDARIELVGGQLALHAVGGQAQARVSPLGVVVQGAEYGLALDDNTQLEISALSGAASFKAPKLTAALTVDAPGRLFFSRGKLKTGPLADRLEVKPVSGAGSSRFQAFSSPGSRVWIRAKGAYKPVVTNAEGRFTVWLQQPRPLPGEIIVTDGLGRQAELGQPSRSLAQLRADVDAGRRAASFKAVAAPPPAEPAPTDPSPADPPPAAKAPPRAAPVAPARHARPARALAPEHPVEIVPIGDEGEEDEEEDAL